MILTETGQNTVSYIYDERDLLYKVTDALGNITEYSYDSNGNLTGITDAKNNITAYQYDGFDRLTKTIYPGSSYEQYLYDTNSNLVLKRMRKGDVINYSYDNLNRLDLKTYPDNSTVDYTYDPAGRLISVTTNNGQPQGLSLQYEYDNLNRVISADNDGVGTGLAPVRYEYDNAGNRTKLTYPDNSSLVYSYDSLNRLTAIKDQTNTVIADYNYDILSRRTSVNLANNTQTTYEYDNLNRLLNLANKINAGVDISTFAYTYDKVGNRITKTAGQGMESYSYDNIYQLTSVTNPQSQVTSYGYDKLENRVNAENKTYTANNLNQYTGIDNGQGNALSLQYDLNGNLTSDSTWTYDYDYENRLVSAVNSTTSANYQYDAFGRRISKEIAGSIEKRLFEFITTHKGELPRLKIVYPYRWGGRTAGTIGVSLLARDIYITARQPNLNTQQKLLKAGIQVGGAAVSAYVGTRMAKWAVTQTVVAPAVGAAIAIGGTVVISWAMEKAQKLLYEKIGLE